MRRATERRTRAAWQTASLAAHLQTEARNQKRCRRTWHERAPLQLSRRMMHDPAEKIAREFRVRLIFNTKDRAQQPAIPVLLKLGHKYHGDQQDCESFPT